MIYLLFAFLMCFVWAGIGSWVAGERGRDKLSWGMACFLFGFLALIVLAIVPSKAKKGRGKKK